MASGRDLCEGDFQAGPDGEEDRRERSQESRSGQGLSGKAVGEGASPGRAAQ